MTCTLLAAAAFNSLRVCSCLLRQLAVQGIPVDHLNMDEMHMQRIKITSSSTRLSAVAIAQVTSLDPWSVVGVCVALLCLILTLRQ
jgi:hypothetical protein